MSFRKRNCNIVSSASFSVVDVQTSQDGVRDSVRLSEDEFFVKHPIPQEEFTLEEQIASGVSLKQIPCESLLNDDHGNFSCEDDEHILENLENQTKVNNPNDILTNE